MTPRYIPIRIKSNVYTKTGTGMFIAALFKIAKKKGEVGENNPNFHQLINKHNMVYPYNGILFGRHTK